ncbi:NADP-dependent 3-hydroxy acid dehydrogenase YdfG [Salinihabitans flavidus]|uniref:NADP-dependent 3-hydroxy acid dehydrogenase YdfG n=1 Tax=Salinihabitans flavidus TaxID=569882 RepID=A0A1H8VHC4_9RHOB|nr:SDR family oxidoreductase [Salinihabitans flavidus]SEP14852.1 NADP-dependent 3-hydroxy acid dehydrogenase YdfG [Salinihabitans flavidus]
MKTILITGASSGIGRATAELFLDKGWQVGLLARRRDALEDVAQGHDGAVILPADVTDPDATARAFDSFAAKAGRLDVLFNNAGMFGPSAPPDEVTVEDFDAVMAVNLRGMFIAARLAFAQMRAQVPQGGRIVNNGSISAHSPRPGSICYTTTKHAVTGLTKSLSLDGRPFDIACGQLDIGNARTELVQALVDKARQDDPDASGPPTMDVTHAARAVLHMAELPAEANVQFMTVTATQMPFIGRG